MFEPTLWIIRSAIQLFMIRQPGGRPRTVSSAFQPTRVPTAFCIALLFCSCSVMLERSGVHLTVQAQTLSFSSRKTVSRFDGQSGVMAQDFDNDGNVDVMVAGQTVRWYRNLGAGQISSAATVLDSPVVADADSFVVDDFDLDGWLDVIVAYGENIVFHRHTGATSVSFNATIISAPVNTSAASVHLVADINADGLPDVVTTASRTTDSNRTLWWHAGLGSSPWFAAPQQIPGPTSASLKVDKGDLDRDGLVDLVVAPIGFSSALSSYRNLGGGTWSAAVRVGPTSEYKQVVVADFNNDGWLDVASASIAGIQWFRNNESLPAPLSFRPGVVIAGDLAAQGSNALTAVDVDGNGAIDLASANSNGNRIAWYQNAGSPNFNFTTNFINDGAGNAGIVQLAGADIDGDGEIDLLSTAGQTVWYQNQRDLPLSTTRNIMSFTPRLEITILLQNVNAVDLNGDGFVDVVASTTRSTLFWSSNSANTVFGATTLIKAWNNTGNELNYILLIGTGDINGDGRVDIVCQLQGFPSNDSLVWFRNEGGVNPVFTEILIRSGLTYGSASLLNDLDNDGFLDIVFNDKNDSAVVYLQNNGSGSFGFSQPLLIANSVSSVQKLYTSDLNADSRPDLIVAHASEAYWFRRSSVDGPTPSYTAGYLIFNYTHTSLTFADLDRDGWPDVVISAFSDNSVSWCRNSQERCRYENGNSY